MYEFVLTGLGALLASYFTNVGLDDPKYKSLKKPSWFPPGYAFGIAWTIIYILFALSWYRVPKLNYIYLLNLLFNVLWCFVFFYKNMYNTAFYILLTLNVILLAQIGLVYRVDSISAYMLIPYLIWTCFASYLNYSINDLNK